MKTLAVKRFYSYGLGLLLMAIYLAYSQLILTALILPALLFGLCLVLLSLDKILLLIAFCTPFSVKILIGNSGINLINEPLMLVMMLVFFIKLFEQSLLIKEQLKHPLTLAIVINLLWVLLTTLTSSMPLVSFKFFIARLWFIVTGFFWGSILFTQPKKIKAFLLAFGLGLTVVVFYTFSKHYLKGFSQDDANKVMKPFMDDHTIYGAVCAIVLVYSLIITWYKNSGVTFTERLLAFFISGCALVGVIFSYSRAVWLSIAFAFVFYLILKLKIRFKTLVFGLMIILSVAFIYHEEIYQQLRFNKTASGKSLQGDIKSIANVKTDESNVERLNRWEAGWRMFKEKPFLGFGPGTYMFKYSPYQRAHEMTSISTTQGTMGNIHSEYFGPLVESGVFGLITMLFIFGIYIQTLMKTYYQTVNKEVKMLCLALLLSLMTYFFHGLMNNFLDQDKAAVIFWAMMGMCIAIAIRHKADASETLKTK
jgi:putative inorganic carbon (hco3(-)) transporter